MTNPTEASPSPSDPNAPADPDSLNIDPLDPSNAGLPEVDGPDPSDTQETPLTLGPDSDHADDPIRNEGEIQEARSAR